MELGILGGSALVGVILLVLVHKEKRLLVSDHIAGGACGASFFCAPKANLV